MPDISPGLLEDLMLSNMNFEPTRTQRHAIHALALLVCSEKSNPTLVINGYAGTGKTSLMKSFCDAMDAVRIPVVLLAPTGRAAKVLAGYTGRKAHTVHRAIYRQRAADALSPFEVAFSKHRGSVFIVDEASMVGDAYVQGGGGATPIWGAGRLLQDLISFVFSQPGCRLALVGDPDQLPPIGQDKTPGLDVDHLRGYGLTVGRVWLSDVVRQEHGGLILKNAMALRRRIEEGGDNDIPRLECQDGADVERVPGSSLLEAIEGAFSSFGIDETVVITRSNRRATLYSIALRSQAMSIESRLVKGDLLIVTRNNYLWSEAAGIDFIANGDIVEVVSIFGYSEMNGLHFADVSIRLVDRGDVDVDCKIILDFLTADVGVPDEETRLKVEVSTAQINERLAAMTAEDYDGYTNQRKRALDIRKDKWINALQVRYAYAMTCHKAQGGQWKAVFVDMAGCGVSADNPTQDAKWLYTAVSRAQEKLFLVNYEDGSGGKTAHPHPTYISNELH